MLGADEESVASALSDMIREYLDEQGWQTFGDVAVSLEQSESLHTGQFRISSIVDPDVDRRPERCPTRQECGRMTQQPGDARPSVRAGVGRMSQPPADQGRDPQQGGQPRTRADQGQQYGQPGYGRPASRTRQGGYRPERLQQGYRPARVSRSPGYPPQPVRRARLRPAGLGSAAASGWEQQYGQQPASRRATRRSSRPVPAGPARRAGTSRASGQQGYPQQGQQGWARPAELRPELRRRQQYGAPQEIIATLSVDDGSGRSYQLQRGSNVIGRGQDAAFRLADTSVSRRHVDIYFDGQSAVLHDLGSTNGTTVNGSSVQTWQLADGDVIHIGHSTVVFSSRY